MRAITVIVLLAIIAFAVGKSEPAKLKKFDPKVFAKCLADKLGVTLDKAVGCALQCKTDVKCYPGCLGVDDKKKVIVAAIECALASRVKKEKKAVKGTKKPKTGKKEKKGTKKPKTGKKEKKGTKKPKTASKTRKCLAKMLKKKLSPKKVEAEKKKVKSILKRLVKKAQRQAKLTKLPIKNQVMIVKDKLNKRKQILTNILRKVTVGNKKDDAEKKLLKKMLREFAAKDLLKTVVQQKILNKVTKKADKKKGTKKPKTGKKEKKGTKKPKTGKKEKKGTKKPKKGSRRPKCGTKKGSRKPKKAQTMSEGPYCDRCNEACEKVPAQFAEVKARCVAACKPVCDRNLSDSEFLGKVGKWLGKAAKTAGKAALGAAKDAAIASITA